MLIWIGLGDFYTKGEPREASVAISMIEKNEWILPHTYADEITYKPPFTHWLTAIFSLAKGEVTPFTSRLPSALSFIGLIVFSFIFFGKNLKFQDAFLACLIMLTSFELHRAAMTARVDMTLTFLIVLGLIRLFRWEERKQLKGFPIGPIIILGLAALVKGPVGTILPLLIFGIYLLVLKYNFLKILKKLIPVAFLSLIFLTTWYFFAYQTGEKAFLDLIWAENFGRFFGFSNLNIQYNLGHEAPVWYILLTLLTGFIPWTILLVISLFGIRITSKIPGIKTIWNNILSLPKIKIFSLISALVIIIFYCIPVSKRSVYLMPAYPFISIFIAQYVLYLTEYKKTISRIFSIFIGFLGFLILLIGTLTIITHEVDPVQIVSLFTKDTKTLADVSITWQSLNSPKILYIVLFCVLIFSLYILIKHLWKKNHLKVLFATIGVYLSIMLIMDGIFFPAFKNGVSIKPFAEKLQKDYPISDNNLFVMNNLLRYSNMYGLNFYLHNNFLNFEKEQPQKGFFLVGKDSFEKVVVEYGKTYDFYLLENVNNKNRDGDKVIQFYSFQRK